MIKSSLYYRSWIYLLLLIILVIGLPLTTIAQKVLSLEECYDLSTKNYPLVKTRELIKKSGEYNLKNISTGYLPSLSIGGQYTYQSDVTKLPINLPGIEIPQIEQDQYKVYADLTQVVFDGGALSLQRKLSAAQTEVDQESLEVELFKLRERINQLYFGILLLKEQIIQTQLLRNELKAGLDKAETAWQNGTMLKSGVDALKAELLKTDARIIELKAGREAYYNMLSLFTGITFDDTTELSIPDAIAMNDKIQRPELSVFNARNKLVSIQSDAITVKNLPKVNLFLQGGYGSPALNMLNPDADTYYIGGIRFIWPLNNFYNIHRDKELNALVKLNLDAQKEVFLFNTSLQVRQQNGELAKYPELIKADEEIIALRDGISQAALVQLENGVITSADYIREATALMNARQLKVLHEIQYLMAQYNYQFITGN